MKWIIVVDDNMTYRKMAELILTGQDMRVTPLESGRALLDFLKDDRPDLVLLDEEMPDLSGFETLRRVRESDAELPVVMMSADISPEAEARRRALGASGTIRKPYAPEEMVKGVLSALDAQAPADHADADGEGDLGGDVLDLAGITSALEERCATSSAMWMGQEAFGNVYRYMMRYMQRYHSTAYRVLFTMKVDDRLDDIQRAEVIAEFRRQMQRSLRNSDVMMETDENQLFLLLPEAHEYDIRHVIDRLLSGWMDSDYACLADVTYEAGRVHLANEEDADEFY